MILSLSVGNSATSLALIDQGVVVFRRSSPPGVHLAHTLTELLGEVGEKPSLAIGVSVRPESQASLGSEITGKGITTYWVGHQVSPGIEISYEPPSAAGLDRIVAARAAFSRHGPAVVVDAGTAVTVDVVGSGPVFLGGAIAPGAGLMGTALGERCALLPGDVRPGEVPALPPNSTEAAIRTGITLGFVGQVDRLVETMLPLAGKDAPLVVTGGDALLWRRYSVHSSVHEPDLIHLGLALMAEEI